MKIPDCTLNNNIAKELIWRRNSPYFYQTLYTQELEWPSLAVQWWTDECIASNNTKEEKSLCYVTYGTHTSGEDKNYLIMAKVYIPNQQYIRKLYKDSKNFLTQKLLSLVRLSRRMKAQWKIKLSCSIKSSMKEKSIESSITPKRLISSQPEPQVEKCTSSIR